MFKYIAIFLFLGQNALAADCEKKLLPENERTPAIVWHDKDSSTYLRAYEEIVALRHSTIVIEMFNADCELDKTFKKTVYEKLVGPRRAYKVRLFPVQFLKVNDGYLISFRYNNDNYHNRVIKFGLYGGLVKNFGDHEGSFAIGKIRYFELNPEGSFYIGQRTYGNCYTILSKMDRFGKLIEAFGYGGSRTLDFYPRAASEDRCASNFIFKRVGRAFLVLAVQRFEHKRADFRFRLFKYNRDGKKYKGFNSDYLDPFNGKLKCETTEFSHDQNLKQITVQVECGEDKKNKKFVFDESGNRLQ